MPTPPVCTALPRRVPWPAQSLGLCLPLKASLPGFTTTGCQHCDAVGVTQAAFAACSQAGLDGFDQEKLPTPDTTDVAALVPYGKVLVNFSSCLGPRWH